MTELELPIAEVSLVLVTEERTLHKRGETGRVMMVAQKLKERPGWVSDNIQFADLQEHSVCASAESPSIPVVRW